MFTNGVVLAMSLQCWLYGLRNTSAGCTAIFEAGGLCVATILSSCLKPVKTERGRLRLFYATVIIIGYVIVTVSPVGHGAAASLNKNKNDLSSSDRIIFTSDKDISLLVLNGGQLSH